MVAARPTRPIRPLTANTLRSETIQGGLGVFQARYVEMSQYNLPSLGRQTAAGPGSGSDP